MGPRMIACGPIRVSQRRGVGGRCLSEGASPGSSITAGARIDQWTHTSRRSIRHCGTMCEVIRHRSRSRAEITCAELRAPCRVVSQRAAISANTQRVPGPWAPTSAPAPETKYAHGDAGWAGSKRRRWALPALAVGDLVAGAQASDRQALAKRRCRAGGRGCAGAHRSRSSQGSGLPVDRNLRMSAAACSRPSRPWSGPRHGRGAGLRQNRRGLAPCRKVGWQWHQDHDQRVQPPRCRRQTVVHQDHVRAMPEHALHHVRGCTSASFSAG